MDSFFYTRLALSNLVKNRKLYLPYGLMNMGIIAMFYIMHSIASNEGISNMIYAGTLSTMLYLGTIVVGIFATILVLYTNSFLVKQRQKELGLYHILGMEKKHIAKMLGMESIISAIACVGIGLISGMILSKLLFMILLKLMSSTVTLQFGISFTSILVTAGFFGVLFFVTLFYNLARIHVSNPINMLKGGNVGEKEPKAKWLMALIGFGTLAYGYYLAQSVNNPLNAIGTFFIAVLLVIVATYALFTSGSIVVLKLLRRNKKFYYNQKHFIAVSGMLYRMKQNASGLASICILSCAVLVSVSTTVSMYLGMEEMLTITAPRSIQLHVYDLESNSLESIKAPIDQMIKENGLEASNVVNYTERSSMITQSGNILNPVDQQNFKVNEMINLALITAEDYAHLENKALSIGNDEIVFINKDAEAISNTLMINNKTYKTHFEYDEDAKIMDFYQRGFNKNYLGVVANESVREEIIKYLDGEETTKSWIYAFDLGDDYEANKAFASEMGQWISEDVIKYGFSFQSRDLQRTEFFGIYGGFFFIGIFLGLLFLMATAMIIYYKQISEGYDDQGRYEILQKVGMSHGEIKKSIKRQIILVFFLPLITAIIHICFAFNVIKHLLTVFGMFNTHLFIMCTVGTVGVFALIYFIVYVLTAKAYYKLLVVNF